jgi:translation initiation factor 3 subunit A
LNANFKGSPKVSVSTEENSSDCFFFVIFDILCLVLSILSIPLPTPRTQIDEHLETEETISDKQKRLTGLLSLQQIPTRTSLIRDMIKQGVLNFIYPELKNMYEWLEVEFNPLKLSSKMEESIQFVEKLAQPDYSQYMPALRDVTVVRLLQQISQVYQTIELKRFIELAPSIDKHRLEKIIVNAAKNRDVQVRIEHKSKALTFGTDINLYNGQSSVNETNSKTNTIQKMPNEQIRNQLISISRALYASMEIINEKSNKERNDKLRREIAGTYARDELIQRKEILKRRDIIESYKEGREKKLRDEVKRKEIVSRHAQDKREEEEKNYRDANEKTRQAEAALAREKEEHRSKMKIAIDKLGGSDIGRRIIELVGEEELYKYDPESLNSLHIDAVIKHSREQKEKLKVQFKKVDFLIRAQHEAEVPLIQEYSKDDAHLRRDIQLAERERAIERRERLIRMEKDKQDFLQSIRGQRHEDFVLQMKEYKQRLQIARQQRLEQLRKEHIEKKKQDFRKEKQLKKQRKIQEKEEKRQAELKRIQDERSAEQRAANAKRNKELDKQAEIQRARDKAIEDKLQEASKNTSTTIRRPVAPPPPPTTHQEKDRTDGPSWRRTPRPNEEKEPSHVDTKDNWRDQRPRGNERRLDDSSNNKGASNDVWRSKPRSEQSNRDDKRGTASPSSSERRTEQNSEKSDNWRTVGKNRPNP